MNSITLYFFLYFFHFFSGFSVFVKFRSFISYKSIISFYLQKITLAQIVVYEHFLSLCFFGKKQRKKLKKQIKEENYQQYRQTILKAVEELNNAIIAIQQELKTNQSQRNAVYSMQKVLNSMREKYDYGLIEFSDLLQTQQNLLKSQTDLANSSGNILKNIVAYYKATGGGY